MIEELQERRRGGCLDGVVSAITGGRIGVETIRVKTGVPRDWLSMFRLLGTVEGDREIFYSTRRRIVFTPRPHRCAR